MRTRLAPTPSGFLHTGNVYNFLLNWLWARSNKGQVLLRIDDGDAARKRPAYLDDIFRVLDWLGLDWDTGPSGPDDFERYWSQTQRLHLYTTVLDELLQKELLFACTCSRQQLDGGVLPCACAAKQLPLSLPGAAWRLKMHGDAPISFPDKAQGAVTVNLALTTGPFVVRRKDGIPAYQLASLADDRHFSVTHIARGEDLLHSTAMQLYTDRLLEQPWLNSCIFWHHPLIGNNGGEKLSKSTGAMGHSLVHTYTRQQILAGFAAWLGIDEPPATPGDMIGMEIFTTSR